MFEIRPYKSQMSVWNPFAELDELERRLFRSDFFNNRDTSVFRTDITDEGDHFVLKADLPGFQKEDIKLQLDGDLLTIKAERHSEHETEDKKNKYICCERSYGSYSRSFDMSGINAEKISAAYNDGVLSLCLPKQIATPPASRQIDIL